MADTSTVTDLTKVLVAQFLKKNGYTTTLKHFLTESFLPRTILDNNESDGLIYEDLESIISDRVQYNEYMIHEKLQTLSINNDKNKDEPESITIKYAGILPSWDHNLKFSEINKGSILETLTINATFSENSQPILSTSNKQLVIKDANLQTVKFVESPTKPKSIIKLCGSIPWKNLNYACGIDGSFYLLDSNFNSIEKAIFKLHSRLISHIQFFVNAENNICYIATAGADNFVKLHTLSIFAVSSSENKYIINTIGEIKILSMCLSLRLIQNNEENKTTPLILITRTDYTHLLCYSVDDINVTKPSLELYYQIALNNTQFSTHSFNIRDMLVLPRKNGTNGYVALATSHIPFMRIIVVKLPKISSQEDIKSNQSSITGISTFYKQIIINMATTIPQTSYSQPILKSLSLQNGLVVGNDEGLYAVDLLKQDSWKLNTIYDNSIVKSMDINRDQDKLIIAYTDKSIHLYDINK
ncbi:hypothetical protein TBLA_0C03890 [Henningerozyma blattae CBS 6284]|uniref:LisH domain-containing protein n=1 Tax=Henningerozyma blattae (strain ATCC 34711 / CBS 6284 / DSM 70876 / NBRC 10599 / NRRL Y-10934 / UCD 77-7) TaxID=1071380 RepID=I2H1D8_HENB6|nr:hypothetical protein TBLA_0C03890 [Tetrapisispora blattae CBS 6284]CCH60190.1 hypothetical protein TBLA_0C03890 [Tetrapisispora blattae CBS 6284]